MSRIYKVLHITNYLDMSGQQETVLETVVNLDQSRFEAHLAANLAGSDRRKVDTILARRARAIPHLTLHHLPHVRIMPSPYHDLRTFIDLYRIMRREKFDIVQTQATKIALLGRFAARLAGVPIIVHFSHGWPFQFTLIPGPMRTGFLLLEKAAARYTDYFMTCDHALLEAGLAHKLGRPDQFTVIRSGMNLDRFFDVAVDRAALREELGLPPTGPIVGTVMIFEAKKKPEWIVEMAPQILAEVPDAHFLLVGDGEMMPAIRALVAELGLQERVTLTGLRDDPHRMMALLDVFVHPAWFDVLPRAIIQAQATGTAVVATHVGGIPEVIADGVSGFLVPPRDRAALVDRVLRLLKDPELRATIGRNARATTSTAFTVEAMIQATEQVYNQLIETELGHPAPALAGRRA